MWIWKCRHRGRPLSDTAWIWMRIDDSLLSFFPSLRACLGNVRRYDSIVVCVSTFTVTPPAEEEACDLVPPSWDRWGWKLLIRTRIRVGEGEFDPSGYDDDDVLRVPERWRSVLPDPYLAADGGCMTGRGTGISAIGRFPWYSSRAAPSSYAYERDATFPAIARSRSLGKVAHSSTPLPGPLPLRASSSDSKPDNDGSATQAGGLSAGLINGLVWLLLSP